MSRKKRRSFTAEQKAAILRRHHVDTVPVSQLCEEEELQPSARAALPCSIRATTMSQRWSLRSGCRPAERLFASVFGLVPTAGASAPIHFATPGCESWPERRDPTARNVSSASSAARALWHPFQAVLRVIWPGAPHIPAPAPHRSTSYHQVVSYALGYQAARSISNWSGQDSRHSSSPSG